MYSVKPIGINTKDNDRDVPDGFLQESINMQWRDGAFKPMPERIVSEISAPGYSNIILHKVGDENRINVIGFNENASSAFLAFDVGGYLGGNALGGNVFTWFGTIVDGVYQTKTATQIPFVSTPGMSFTILNGLIYFMGNGSSPTEQYYVRLEFNDTTGEYKLYDMYEWKSLIPFFPLQGDTIFHAPKTTNNVLSSCGFVLIRFALVLKSGQVVLHSPIYSCNIYGINGSDTAIEKDAIIDNIHTVVNLNLQFADTTLFESEISAINVYASTPYYKTKLTEASAGLFSKQYVYVPAAKDITEKANEPFYLIKTIIEPTTDKIILKEGNLDEGIRTSLQAEYMSFLGVDSATSTTAVYSVIELSSIPAGELMPVDDFSYHKLFGKITSYSGRLVILRPVTVLSGGHMRSLSTTYLDSVQGYSIDTEDGSIERVFSEVAGVAPDYGVYGLETRGILSYPDYRATRIGAKEFTSNTMHLYKSRKNASSNIACNFNMSLTSNSLNITNIHIGLNSLGLMEGTDPDNIRAVVSYDTLICNPTHVESIFPVAVSNTGKYSSENRLQFSEIGELKVWPAINSYRIGEGKVMNLGTGSVNPSESQIISPIIVGTTDGVYTINLDPNGTNFIASITKTANLPFLSEEILEIDQNILFVSDKGLMVFSDGNITNLTEAFFPQQGNGGYPVQETVYPNYDVLTQAFFGVDGNLFVFDDVVKYLKGALFAFDARRNNVWCSNPAYLFSLVYNLDVKQWGMSTMVFDRKFELYSIINTEQEGNLYTRYMVRAIGQTKLLILSGEDLTKEVFYHVLTRPIKFQQGDDYKVLKRMIYRTLLIRKELETAGYFSIGLWGQQDVHRFKKAIPIVAKSDNRAGVYPGSIRYHIPIDCREGKYRSITVLQSGKTLPESYISSFDFDIFSVDNTKMR